jgi:hypothetical protein
MMMTRIRLPDALRPRPPCGGAAAAAAPGGRARGVRWPSELESVSQSNSSDSCVTSVARLWRVGLPSHGPRRTPTVTDIVGPSRSRVTVPVYGETAGPGLLVTPTFGPGLAKLSSWGVADSDGAQAAAARAPPRRQR